MTEAGDIYKSFLKKFPGPIDGSLRVWWIPQVPGKPFHWPVENIKQARVLLDVLASYDDFQFAENVKGDYANAGGLEVYEDGEWHEWFNDEGDGIDEI